MLPKRIWRAGRICIERFATIRRALSELEHRVPVLPNDPRIFQLTGSILLRQGRPEEGLRDLEQAVALDPRNLMTLRSSRSVIAIRRYPGRSSWFAGWRSSPKDLFTRAARPRFSTGRADTGHSKPIERILAEEQGNGVSCRGYLVQCALAERDLAALREASSLWARSILARRHIWPRTGNGLVARND